MNGIIKELKVKVIATEAFYSRRLQTIPFLKKKEYRELQAGEKVEIDKEIYNKNKDILRMVK